MRERFLQFEKSIWIGSMARKIAFEPIVDADGEAEFVVGLKVLARWANRSDERILQWKREGVVIAEAPGRYRLRENLRRIDEHRSGDERQATRSAAGSRVRDARAREIELRIAREQRDLIGMDEATAILDDVIGVYRSSYDGLPARVTRDPVMRRKLEAEIFATQERVATLLEKRLVGADDGAPA